MAPNIQCSCCGWLGRRRDIDGAACPICTHPVHDRWTLGSEWPRFVAFGLIVAAFVGYALLPKSAHLYLAMAIGEHGPDQLQYIHMDSLPVQQTPRGSQLTFKIRNSTCLTISQLRLSLMVHPFPTTHPNTQFGKSLPDLVLSDLAPGEERVVRAEVQNFAPQRLMGWTAKVESVELPDGFWNQELEKIVTIRIFGVIGNVPKPFAEPTRQKEFNQKLRFK